MIPFELIMPSASRPHLVGRTLYSLLTHVDQPPTRVLVHDDAAFRTDPARQPATEKIIRDVCERFQVPLELGLQNPPIYHGPTVKWLLDRVTTEYVLYSQDDHEVLRALPIAEGLRILHEHGWHHLIFNKRTTATRKDYPSKKPIEIDGQPFVISPHWKFQTSLWRVSRIKPVVDWWMAHGSAFHEHCEMKVNHTFNGGHRDCPWPPDVPDMTREDPMDGDVREKYQRTIIWGTYGHPAYVKHIGDSKEDWALPHARGGSEGHRETFQ